jgi:hypothetical protein
MKYLIVVTFLLIPFYTSGQRNHVNKFIADKEWRPGSISLVNGSNRSGYIKFNDKTGLLSFRDEEEEMTFTPNTVNRFTFQQTDSTKREFYALLIQEYEQPLEHLAFFEVLRQFNDFALLARPYRAETKKRRTYSPGVGWIDMYDYVDQNEILYFVDDKGKVMPYMKVTYESDQRRPRAEMLNAHLLKVYTGPHYSAVQKFLKEHKLKVKRRQDLLLVLDHYAQLALNEK